MPIPRIAHPAGSAKSVGIWIRVSTEDQARGESPEHHERRARAYAEAKGWTVREVYHLEAVSGKSVMGHPEAKRMLEHIASGRITGLIFSKLARLARNTRELLDFADLFRDHEADLISLQESIDTTTPAGRLFYTMIAAMAQWEREEIAERVAASVPIRAKLGKSTGGSAPFGYQWKNHQLLPNPAEAPVRKLMYELFLEHKRKKTVARLLNERGYRTRTGGKFSDTTVDRLLRDPVAKGTRRANYTKSLGQKRHWKLKPREDWVLSSVEPIISEETWAKCLAILDRRRAAGQRPARKAVHLFTGYAFCQCGHKLYVPSNQPKYVCYRCHTKIGVGDLESVFHEQLKRFFLSPEDVARHLGRADEEIRTKEERLVALETEASKIRQEMDKTYRLYLADELSPEGFGRTYKPLEERLKALETEQPRLQGELDFLRVQYLGRDEILAETQDLYERWPNLAADEKRAIVEAIVEQIRVGKEDVEFDLSPFTGSAEEPTEEQRNLRDSSPPR
ncbi:MAG: recombinase family protein [Candidatus Eisenbacteria bacterium]|nr:recombinase family protein [Candidatus Eisenbacteria bacterium]